MEKTFDIATLIASIITLFGVIITAIVSVRNIKKESYNKRVTEERIKWLNKVRDDYSIVMAAYECYHASNGNSEDIKIDKNIYDNRMFEADIARYDLISRLNTSKYLGNEYNFVLKDVLNELNFASGRINVSEERIESFKKYMNLMLEQEWNRSKKEI